MDNRGDKKVCVCVKVASSLVCARIEAAKQKKVVYCVLQKARDKFAQ